MDNQQLDADGWPERPRLFTGKSILITAGLLVFASGMALAILKTRHMESTQTRGVWGESFSMIGQARPVELMRPTGSTTHKDLEYWNEGWINLTDLRDIAYFRRVFMDDKNFDWSRQGPAIPPGQPSAWPWSFIRFGHEKAESPTFTLAFHVKEGYVGIPGASESFCLKESTARRLSNRIELFARVKD